MSQQFLFPNFYNTTLAASLSSTAINMSVATSTGLPTLLSGQVIPLILTPKSSPGSTYEIVYVTAISGTTLTIERGMEGTVAQNWNSGDLVLCGPTGESVSPVRSWHAPVASETLPVGNDLLVMPGTLGAAITLTIPATGMVVGNKYRIYGSASAYAVTVTLTNATGSPFIHLPDGTQVYSYVLPASAPQNGIELEWDGTNWKGFNFGIMSAGSLTISGLSVTANTTLTQSMINQPLYCSGTITLTLPASPSLGWAYKIRNVGSGILTLSGSSNLGPSLLSSITMSYKGQAVTLEWNGSFWEATQGHYDITEIICTGSSGTITTTPSNIAWPTKVTDLLSEYNTSTGVFTPKESGYYLIGIIAQQSSSNNDCSFTVSSTSATLGSIILSSGFGIFTGMIPVFLTGGTAYYIVAVSGASLTLGPLVGSVPNLITIRRSLP